MHRAIICQDLLLISHTSHPFRLKISTITIGPFRLTSDSFQTQAIHKLGYILLDLQAQIHRFITLAQAFLFFRLFFARRPVRSTIAVGFITVKLATQHPSIHLLDQLHFARLADAQPRLAFVQTFEHHAGLANVLTRYVAAAYAGTALWQSERVLNEHRLTRMNDIDYDARPDHFELFEECTCMASVRVRRVDAFGRKIIKLLRGRKRVWISRLLTARWLGCLSTLVCLKK